MPLVLIAGAAIAALYFYSKTLGHSVDQLNASIKSVDIKANAFSIYNSTINLKLIITNPGNAAIVVDSFSGTLLYNGSQLAKVNYLQKFSVPARSQGIYTIPVTINNFGLIREILVSATKGAGKPVITVTGTVNAGAFSKTISQTTTVNL